MSFSLSDGSIVLIRRQRKVCGLVFDVRIRWSKLDKTVRLWGFNNLFEAKELSQIYSNLAGTQSKSDWQAH